ncbi:MAG: high frequency lysogenization protein [Motiliproteus sp.]|jgi:high frequency lysogenization protein
MSRSLDQQTIALAGIFQAASLVDQIAKRGIIPQNSFEASINSIFVTSPDATEDVFGGARDLPFNLQTGLKMARDLSDKGIAINKDMTRYAMGLLHLESRLRKHPQMLEEVGKRLEQIGQQALFFNSQDNAGVDPAHPTDTPQIPLSYARGPVVANIAALYQETLSTFSFRIQVTGEPRHLQNKDNAEKIRALLLAGIRSAILWHQVGGRRWHLLFFRSRVGESAKRILQSAQTH